jgi:hypothetical protein
MALHPASLIRGNLAVLWLVLVSLIFSVDVVAQTGFCQPEPYPSIPGQWASSGQVVEASDPFQTVSGATMELRSTHLSYEQAKDKRVRDGAGPTNLIKTVVSDSRGKFEFGELSPGAYEIRAVMAGHELAAAYVLMDRPPQWVGRGLRVALSYQGKGCSRIYAAGLDDTDCGRWECGNLPPGEMKVVHTDGTPLSRTRLLFYRHSKMAPHSPELDFTTGTDGVVNTSTAHGCYDIRVENSGSIHLCFSRTLATESITVRLSPDS